MLEFHNGDDAHAPFPHRVVNGKFVICAECDHWIEREVSLCQCKQHCHNLAAVLRELGGKIITVDTTVGVMTEVESN